MTGIEHPAADSLCLDRLLHALSDPERRGILAALREGEQPCSDLLPDRPRSTVSVHLKVLREAGLIEQERRGKLIMNRRHPEGAAERFPNVLAAIETAEAEAV